VLGLGPRARERNYPRVWANPKRWEETSLPWPKAF